MYFFLLHLLYKKTQLAKAENFYLNKFLLCFGELLKFENLAKDMGRGAEPKVFHRLQYQEINEIGIQSIDTYFILNPNITCCGTLPLCVLFFIRKDSL